VLCTLEQVGGEYPSSALVVNTLGPHLTGERAQGISAEDVTTEAGETSGE